MTPERESVILFWFSLQQDKRSIQRLSGEFSIQGSHFFFVCPGLRHLDFATLLLTALWFPLLSLYAVPGPGCQTQHMYVIVV